MLLLILAVYFAENVRPGISWSNNSYESKIDKQGKGYFTRGYLRPISVDPS